MSTYHELTEGDVGKIRLRLWGRTWALSGLMGRVLPIDVGKRIYLVGDILQVENEGQRAARKGAAR